MMSNTLGAPFGGTTRGGHQVFDSEALSLITPPNFGSGGGSCLPSIVVVALGEPSTPVTCGADASDAWVALFSADAGRERRSNCAELVGNRLKNNANTNPATAGRWPHRFSKDLFSMAVSIRFY